MQIHRWGYGVPCSAVALLQPKKFSSNEGGISCIADIRGHVTHHDASFWIERWHRPALSRAALVLPFLVALGQAQIGKGVPFAKLREDASVWPFPQQYRCGCQRVLKAVPAGFGRTELGLTSLLQCIRISWNALETKEGSSVL